MSDLLKKATEALEKAGFVVTDYADRPDLYVRNVGQCHEFVSLGRDRARVSLNVPMEQVPSIVTPDPSILSGGVQLTEKEHAALVRLLDTTGVKQMMEHPCPCGVCEATRDAITVLYVLRNRYSNRLTGGGAS